MWAELSNGFDLLALVATVGALVQRHWLLAHHPKHPTTVALAWMHRQSAGYFLVALSLLTLTTAVALLVRSADISGLPVSQLAPIFSQVLEQTHFGRIWLIRMAALIMLWAGWWIFRRRAGFILFTALAMMAEAWGWSATGHPGDHGDLASAVWVSTLHILSAGLWGGTILAVAIVVFPAPQRLDALDPDAVVRFSRRLSVVSTVGLTLLVATGIYNAWNALGHFSSLWTTAYGYVLDIKLGLMSVMAGIGFGNRYRRVPALVHACRTSASPDWQAHPLRHQASRRLLMAVAAEAIVLLGIMAMVSVLVHTMPPVTTDRMMRN